MRTHRYREIADDLRSQLAGGEPAAGRLLPSESDLAAAYDASRVTVRRALEVLRDEGLIDSRQGFGWFVAADRLRQHLGQFGTLEGQLEEAGITSERRVLDFGFIAAPAAVKRVLGVRRVLEVRRLNLAGGQPFALVTVWCPETVGRGFSLEDVERSTFYELLATRLGGASQTIAAAAAEPDEAVLLEVPVGSPVLRCRRTTRDDTGDPVLYSEHVFAAHRTEFVVDLPRAEPSIAPSGIRLVASS